jgi:diguanylate cyclase (GGDEF)-like protein/PAS domain S-box-containing protein
MSSLIKIFPTPKGRGANENVLRLLIIESSSSEAQWLVKILRNSGYCVRQATPKNPEELLAILQSHPIDLAICSAAARTPSLEQVSDAINACGKDVPLIALAAYHNPEMHLASMQIGASDLVCKNELEHLQLVVQRELAGLQIRRKLKMSEQLVYESETRYRTLLDNSRDAVAYVHDGMHIHANAAYLGMFGFKSLQEIESIPIMDMVAPQDHAKFKEFLRHYRSGEHGAQELQILSVRLDGTAVNTTMVFAPSTLEGEPCTQIIIRNTHIDREPEKRLKFLGKQDPITGLLNRQHFLGELEQVIATQADTSAVLYLEPDKTQTVKEAVGDTGNNLLLRDIATLIGEMLDKSHLAARFGDHTFTVLARHIDLDSALKLAEKIRAAVEHHNVRIFGQSISVTCSIGITQVSESGSNAQEVLSDANMACDLAKQQGGNRLHLLNPANDQDDPNEEDQPWINLIRDALDHNQFTLVYQPISSLHGDTREKYAVLLRMQDQQGEMILPDQFIPVAEQHNLIAAIDRWVILNAVKMLIEWRRRGLDAALFIKVSRTSMEDETLLPWLGKLLENAQVPGDRLVFELPDNVVVDIEVDVEANELGGVKLFLQGLQQLHCGFCLDHFGNSESVFQLLAHLPTAYLRIDESITNNLSENEENQAFLKAIVEIAQSMGKSTIAQYVEDTNNFELLRQAGVDYIQGCYL